jgi:hypothetical protein
VLSREGCLSDSIISYPEIEAGLSNEANNLDL